MDQGGLIFFLKEKKNLPRTKFAPLYIFDIENEVKNMINYVSCD